MNISTGSAFAGHDPETGWVSTWPKVWSKDEVPFFVFMPKAPLVRRRLIGDESDITNSLVLLSFMALSMASAPAPAPTRESRSFYGYVYERYL